MALLVALHELAPELGISLTVAHLNHGLRGPAAEEDQQFVRNLAERLCIRCITERKDVRRLALRIGESLEMAGRRARYDFFVRAARKLGCTVAATAHTADDQAETIMLKVARGTGSSGLRGILRSTCWKRLKIVRPLLDVSRESIVQFLGKSGTAWREDASNLDTTFLRNRVRHEVIPFLESTLNPEVKKALLRLGNIMEEEGIWLDSMAAKLMDDCRASYGEDDTIAPADISCASLSSHPVAARRRVLRLWLASAGMPHELLDFETTERLDLLLTSWRTPGQLTLQDDWIVRREYGRLITSRNAGQIAIAFCERLKIPGETILKEQRLKITISLEPGFSRKKPAGIGRFPAQASLNAALWRRRRMVVRSWRTGDRMSPFGMIGSRKIQDIFTDAKTPKRLRHCAPLFECGREIIWLPGYRIANGWEVPDSGARALQVKVERI